MATEDPKLNPKKRTRFTDASPSTSPIIKLKKRPAARLSENDSENEDNEKTGYNVSSTESEDSDVEKIKLIRKAIDKDNKKKGIKTVAERQDYGDEQNENVSKRLGKTKNGNRIEKSSPENNKKKVRKRKKDSSASSSSSSSSSSSGSSSGSDSNSSEDEKKKKSKRRRQKK